MHIRLPAVAAVLLVYFVAAGAQAQDSPPPASGLAPANLAYVEGGVEVTHEGVSERADPPTLLEDGDIIRTPSGRAEIVFSDGTILHLDYSTEIELLAPDRVRLLRGRALFRVSAAAAHDYVVDTPAAIVRLAPRGEYGIGADDQRGDLDLTVARGVADVDDGTSRSSVRAGERFSLAGPGARPLFQPYNAARFDAFERWSSDRTNGFAAATSAASLPYELRAYGPVLDQSGRWDYVEPYGQVWFPSVGVGWRPYYEGAWGYTRHGWTWHGRDRWAWPTHHYGRWGFNGSFWYWIPARVWGPAWVVWGGAPGYVSWSPLGWNGLPVIGFGHYGHVGPYNPWRAWTVVPRHHFGYRRAVRLHAIDGDRLDDSIRRGWSVQALPPATPLGYAPLGYAVPRERRGNVRRPSAGDSANPYQGLERDRSTRMPGVVRDQRVREAETPVVRSAPPPSARERDVSQSEPDRQPRDQGGYVTSRPSDRGARDSGGDRGGAVDRAVPRGQPRTESARSGNSGETGGRSRGGSVGSAQGQGASQGQGSQGQGSQGQGSQGQGASQRGAASGGAARRSPPR
jgi:hypothetical protein